MFKDRLEKLADLILESDNIVFFGGAGVSTESGMKDYRSEDGLYNTVKQYKVSPETILSRSFFNKYPETFYDFYYNYFLKETALPNRAHFALAEMEEKGKLKGIITQNIDGLHQKAGSKNVIELHGTTSKHYCVNCGAFMGFEKVKDFKGKVPKCEKCGGIIKPKVVLYEEALDEKVINDAVKTISNANLLIIGGTSLAVYPAANFLNYFNGDNVVLINKEETPYDRKASLIFRESIGEVLEKALELI